MSAERLLLFRLPPDHKRWSCGHLRKRVVHLTNPNAREGSPYERCSPCVEDDRRQFWRDFSGFLFGLVIAFTMVGACCTGLEACR